MVLVITAIREALDDYARYKADEAENNRLVTIVERGQRLDVPSSSITPGTLVVVPEGACVPCDLAMLNSGSPDGDGRGYVETAALDGESDLKVRCSAPSTQGMSPEELSWLNGCIKCPAPNSLLYHFDAVLELEGQGEPGAASGPRRLRGASSGSSALSPTLPPAAVAAAGETPPRLSLGASWSPDMEEGRKGSFGSQDATPLPRARSTTDDAAAFADTGGAATQCMTTPGSKVQQSRSQDASKCVALSGEQLLQGGTIVRDTPWVAGVAVYTGGDTKLNQSSTIAPDKHAFIDQRINELTLLVFVGQLALVCFLGLVGAGLNSATWLSGHWYLGQPGEGAWQRWIVLPVRFLLLNSFMIPVSLKVLLDIAKGSYARMVASDSAMRHAGTPAAVQNTNVIEDLGIVTHVLSDKTGTLTDNVMVFHSAFSVAGRHEMGAGLAGRAGSAAAPFWTALALCSSVHPKQAGSVRAGQRVASWTSLPEGLTSAVKLHPAQDTAVQVGEHGEAESLVQAESPTADSSSDSLAAAQAIMAADRTSRHAVTFQSTSPDEEALVHAAALAGHVLAHRAPGPHDSEVCTLRRSALVADAVWTHAQARRHDCDHVLRLGSRLPSKAVWYAGGERSSAGAGTEDIHTCEQVVILHTLAFSSERKRMSVIVQPADTPGVQAETSYAGGPVWLLSKGADDVMLSRMAPEHRRSHFVSEAEQFAGQCASSGLRTMLVCARKMEQEEYLAWAAEWNAAGLCMSGRAEALQAAAEKAEHSWHLLGVTAIEDALQAGVPQTLTALREAGIATWMLTGDKYATALQIATSSKLVPRYARFVEAATGGEEDAAATSPLPRLFEIQGDDTASVRHAVHVCEAAASKRPDGYLVAVDGSALDFILNRADSTAAFTSLVLGARSVVCSRASPSHKRALVALVQESATSGRCLAIGDGGNDVPMIQASHVGVGMSGREGQQAARNADVQVSQFRHLAPLLLVHGRRAHWATSFITLFAIYKSIALCTLQILFNVMFAHWSGGSLLDGLSLTSYNTLFTSLPLILVVLCSDVDLDTAQRSPRLYQASQKNSWLNRSLGARWGLVAACQGCIVFFVAVAAREPSGTVSALSYTAFLGVLLTVFGTLLWRVPKANRWLRWAVAGCCSAFVLLILAKGLGSGGGAAEARIVWKYMGEPTGLLSTALFAAVSALSMVCLLN